MAEHILSREPKPGVSIIIPTYKRDESLQRALLAVAAQTIEAPLEVIVADNWGQSTIPAWLNEQRPPLPVPVTYVSADAVAGSSCARNVGAARAAYRYLAFLDDDAFPLPDWAQTVLDFFDAHPEVAILAGRMEANRLEHPLEHSRQFLYDARDARYRDPETTAAIAQRFGLDVPGDYYLADYFTAADCACRASVFVELGGFDTAILHGQDHDLAIRCLQRGHGVAYVPELRVRHEHGRSYARFMRQTFQHGISTTERVVHLERERGFLGELSRQAGLLLHEVSQWLHAWRPGTSPHLRASRRIMALRRIIHLGGVLVWAARNRLKRPTAGGTAEERRSARA